MVRAVSDRPEQVLGGLYAGAVTVNYSSRRASWSRPCELFGFSRWGSAECVCRPNAFRHSVNFVQKFSLSRLWSGARWWV